MISLWGGPVDAPCLLDSFHRTAVARADQDAVVDAQGSVTYAELLARARGVAATIRDAGLAPGERVAVTGPRGVPIVTAMMGVLWAGTTYVPLDSSYPVRRLAHMLSDSGARLLLADGTPPALEPSVPHRAIPVTAGTTPAVGHEDALPTYVIYTSGSTGWPKGVAVPHRCLDTMVEWQRRHSVRADLRTAQFAPLNFDVSFQEVLGTLCGGGTLVIVPEHLRQDPYDLLDWLRDSRIERLFLPYVALQMLAVAASDEDLADLRLAEVNTAGEQVVCTPDIRRMFERLGTCRLNNHYGQSESAMVTVHTLTGPPAGWPALPPIGTPLPGCETLVATADPDEPGVGELLVTGDPLSEGYLNQPELTAARYVDIPRTPQGNTRAFRTGDLVRIENGVIHFLARKDQEVKIRGYRVNLLEIEAQLLTIPGVGSAVCVARESQGSKSVHAVITPEPGAPAATPERIAASLATVLPEAHLPQSVVTVAELPRTLSGKVDREAVAAMVAGP